MSDFDQSPYDGVVFKRLNLVNIDFDSAVLFHVDNGIFDVSKSALGEDIELGDAEVFCFEHAKLYHGKSFGWLEGGAIMVDVFFGDEDAAHVDAEVVGEVVDAMGVFEQGGIFFGGVFVEQRIDFGFGQAKYFAEFSDNGIALKCAIGGQESCAMVFVFVEDVSGNVVSVLPRKVKVEVGRTTPMWVDESLEVEVEVYGVHIRNSQAVGNHGVGAGATADVEVVVFSGESTDVPIDKEVGGKSEFVDHLHFLF